MGIKEIVAHEERNQSDIILQKQGLFWCAYEVSAFLFVRLINNFKPLKKHYKVIDREVVSVGFPEPGIEQMLSIASALKGSEIDRGERQIIIRLSNPDHSDFDTWKKSIPLIEREKTVFSSDRIIVEKVRSFSVVSMTPLDAQAFIIKLQKEINDKVR